MAMRPRRVHRLFLFSFSRLRRSLFPSDISEKEFPFCFSRSAWYVDLVVLWVAFSRESKLYWKINFKIIDYFCTFQNVQTYDEAYTTTATSPLLPLVPLRQTLLPFRPDFFWFFHQMKIFFDDESRFPITVLLIFNTFLVWASIFSFIRQWFPPSNSLM